ALAWNRGFGLRLQYEIRAAAADLDGWPETGRLAGMFEGGASGPLGSASMTIDPLDVIMAESRQSAERQKREDLLRWLLEE
ncbi:MAG: hypothetical protein B7Z15_22250, partial [Rhizobiales bacterium 32-66-8]